MTPEWEINELEQALAARPPAESSPALRQRVQAAVRGELRRQRMRGWTLYAAQVAAVLALWTNLSWNAVRETDYDGNLRGGPQEIATVAAQIEQLAPGISRREALRQAVLLHSAWSLTAVAPASPRPSAPLRFNPL